MVLKTKNTIQLDGVFLSFQEEVSISILLLLPFHRLVFLELQLLGF